MQLWYAPTSPFARKARVAAHELGLDLELIETDPWTDQRLRRLNPLGKVPTLVLSDGDVVWESGLIAERLEALADRRLLFPAPGPERWRALGLQALCDGACTAAGRLFADERRPAAQRQQAMARRFQTAIDAALDYLEAAGLRGEPAIGEISAAMLAGYLDFRWPDRQWRTGRPALAHWFEGFARRPSMTATAHHLPQTSDHA